jgi:uncharacterized membrane protein
MPTVNTSKPHQTKFSKSIDNNIVPTFAPFHWLSLAVKDFIAAPLLSLTYGVLFAAIPASMLYFVDTTDSYLIILPMSVAFALIRPIFSAALYDVSWELEKGHKPSFSHSLKSLFRNTTGAWSFAIVLMVVMIAWMRIAALVHAIYPDAVNPSFEELLSFLTLGTILGAIILCVVMMISAFTPQIMLERRVDIMTAIATSVRAVNDNMLSMLVWGLIIMASVLIGFVTLSIGFIFIMPILSYASWHAYIAVIKTKIKRNYE